MSIGDDPGALASTAVGLATFPAANEPGEGSLWRQLLADSTELFSLPAVALELLELTSSPTVDVARLKQCLERDPALVAKVLRVVNSSLYGLSQPVRNLNQALALLGIKRLKLLVLGFSLPHGLTEGVASDVLARYWKHTLTKAVAARELAEHVWNLDGDEALLAGLLADLGMLALIQQLGQPYVQIVERVRQLHRDLSSAERHALGFDHRQLTAELLRRWRMPIVLVDAISADGAAQVSPGSVFCPQSPMAQILHLADLLALLLADGQTEMLPEILKIGARQQLGDAQLAQLAASLERKVAQLADVLTLELPGDRAYEEILAEAHAGLVRAARDGAEAWLGERARHVAEEDPGLAEALAALSAKAQRVEMQSVVPAAAHTSHHPAPRPHRTDAAAPLSIATSSTKPALDAGSRVSDPADDGSLIDLSPSEALTMAVNVCRQSRWALSVLLVEIDKYPALMDAEGRAVAARHAANVELVCRRLDHAGRICTKLGEAQWRVLLPACDRTQATELGQDLLRRVRAISSSSGARLTVSVGVAALQTPPRNFNPELLAQSAQRCLHAARIAGGNSLKSIEIY